MFIKLLKDIDGFKAGVHDIPAQTARRYLQQGVAVKPQEAAKKQAETRETRGAKHQKNKDVSKRSATTKSAN